MKKILSILLIIAVLFTLSTASVSVMAADEVVKNDTYFFSSIGVFPEGIEEDTALTRIQLAEIFYNIVFSEGSEAGKSWGEFNFIDVPEEKKHIASTAAGLGAMRGYSENVFGPDDVVTYAQTVKAIVSFMGYDLQAGSMGGYPGGYLAQASRLQILPVGNIAGDTQATYGIVATILKKAINKDIAIWNRTTTDGTATQDVLKGTDYLEYYMGISLMKGRITGNYLTNIKSGENTNYFGIRINGFDMEVAKTAHGVQDLLGYDVYVYYTDVEGIKTVIYYEPGNNNVVEIDAGNIVSVNKSSIAYYKDGYDSAFTADFASNAVLIYNGTSEASFTPADINPFAANKLDGGVKLIDADGNDVFEAIVVTAFKTIVVKNVIDNKIYAEYDMGDAQYKVIDISNYKERNINIRNISGGAVDPANIKKGIVLNVCADKNGVIKEIIGSKDSMTGVIEEISFAGSKISAIKISGAEFKASQGIVLIDSANKLKSGVTATIFFNCKADVALIDLEQNYADGYSTGYLVDAGVEGGIEKNVLCMIFDSTGEMKTFDLADKVSLNDKAESAEVVLQKLGETNGRVKRQLILYKTDLEGKVVTAIEIPQKLEKDDDAFNGLYQYPGDSHYYSGGYRTMDDKYLVNAKTICFAVPAEEDRDEYHHYSMSTLSSSEGFTIGTKAKPRTDMQIFGTKEEALVVSHVVMSSSEASSSGGDLDKRPMFVVSKVATAVDEDGETKLKVFGVFIEGTSVYEGFFYVNPELLITGHEKGYSTDIVATGTRPFIDQTETIMEPGDIFKLPYFRNNGNKIETMNCEQFYQLYDVGSDTFYENAGPYGSGIGYSADRSSGGTHHYFGYVVYNDGTSVKTVLGNEVAPESPKYRAYEFSAGYYKFIEVTKRASDGEITVKISKSDAIRSERDFPGKASRLLTLLRGVGIGCIILNFK